MLSKTLITIEKAVADTSRQIVIERTKTNQELNRIEKEYSLKLKKYFNDILRYYDDNKNKIVITVTDLETKYGQQVKNTIRLAVQQTYILGLDYLKRARQEKQEIFLSSNDIENIKQQTEEIYAFFWRQVKRHVDRKDEIDFLQQQTSNDNDNDNNIFLTDKNDNLILGIFPDVDNNNNNDNQLPQLLSIDASTTLIASAISNTVLNLAVVDKLIQLQNENDVLLLSQQQQQQRQIKQTPKLIFKTSLDDRVCPICAPNEYFVTRIEYDINNNLPIPRPPLHPRCRCRLLLKYGDDIISK